VDPIANLQDQRELAREILRPKDHLVKEDYLAHSLGCAERIADLFQALDEWRRKGGFDPYSVGPDGVREVTASEIRAVLYESERPMFDALVLRVVAGATPDEPVEVGAVITADGTFAGSVAGNTVVVGERLPTP
jgi:hypothetical protein